MRIDPHYSEALLQALLDVDRPKAAQAIEDALAANISPEDVIIKVLNVAMDQLGEMQAQQLVVLAQVYIAAQIADNALNRLLPLLQTKRTINGTIVLGNILGDNHALGRKTVGTFLKVAGYEVHDLGISVPLEDFVAKAKETKAEIIGVSALLLHTARLISQLRPMLEAEGMSEVKILVGGAPFNLDPKLHQRLGADAMAVNATESVRAVRILLARPVQFYDTRTGSVRWRDAITGRFVPAPTTL
jgi:methylmalonyl-CoA mutase cobalamin-binding domain/chain